MAARKFKFVSPGVFLKEIDNSQIPKIPGALGPVIIGRTRKGPSMKPYKVASFQEFETVFGQTVPGNQADDPWRNPGLLATAYAPYAAQAYLKSQTPVTMIRLAGILGDDASASVTDAYPGWQASKPWGLFLVPSSSVVTAPGSWGSGQAMSASLAGIFYGTSLAFTASLYGSAISSFGTRETLLTPANGRGGTTGNEDSRLVAADSGKYTVVLSDGTTSLSQSVSFTPGESSYIRDVLNTNPVRTTTRISTIVSGTLSDKYWLGETFEQEYRRLVVAHGADNIYAFTMPLQTAASSGSMADFKSILHESAPARTGWIFHQHHGLKADYAPRTGLQKLFRVLALQDGEEPSKNLMIEIENIRIPDEGSFNPYGTFSVTVKMITNTSLETVERFDQCNLNPNSENYVAKKVGDQYFAWSKIEKRNKIYGSNPNNSQFIRVEVHSDISENGPENNSSVPFGFFGPVVPKSMTVAKTSTGTGATATITFDGNVTYDQTVTILDAQGTSRTYTSKNQDDSSGSDLFWSADGDNPQISTNLRNAIRSAGGHNGTITADANSSVITLTQATHAPAHPDWATITADIANGVATNFTGGSILSSYCFAGQGGGHDWVTGSLAHPFAAALASAADTADDADPGHAGIVFHWPRNPTVNYVKEEDFTLKPILGATPFRLSSTSRESSLMNEGYLDFNRRMPEWGSTHIIQTSGIVEASNTEVDYSYVFSLDDVFIGGASTANISDLSNFAITEMRWATGSHVAGASYTGTDNGTAYALVRDAVNSFRLPLAGGFAGVDIKEADPFNMNIVGADATTANSYAYASIDRAIEMIRDPEAIEMNLAAMPGITNDNLTTKLVEACEARADALAVIDLPDVYIEPWQTKCTTFEARINSKTPAQVAAALTKRQLNSSYGATYYPWVKVRDNTYNRDVWVPPSVVALGVMAYSEEKSNHVWFAPAGFNRGGLNEGNAGIPVLQVTTQLLSKQRDTLYEANINPIASFVTEGLVVFGQKTLQTTQSALDRINVRRLLIFIKRRISMISSGLLFDQNLPATWNRFKSKVVPFLEGVKTDLGLSDFRVILDESTTTPDLIDRNIMYAKIFLKPARAIEFIAVDFVITSTGASFGDPQ